ncbi:hypothetical protein M3I65_07665 [Escherichia coli]|nr:hypothetical protein [Escherichia coli]
MERHGLCHPG